MKNGKNRDIASELNALFTKSRKKLNKEQIISFLPKLSLESLLQDDQEAPKINKIKVPKVSSLKGKEEKVSVNEFISKIKRNTISKNTREDKTIQKEIIKARSPSPELDLKVCMVGRKLESPIRNLKGYDLEPDTVKLKEELVVVKDDLHDSQEIQILEPILVVESFQDFESGIKELKDVDDVFKKYTQVLVKKDLDLQNSRKGSSYVENLEFSSSVDLTESLQLSDILKQESNQEEFDSKDFSQDEESNSENDKDSGSYYSENSDYSQDSEYTDESNIEFLEQFN